MARWNSIRRDRSQKAGRRRFQPTALRLEERTLLSSLLDNLPDPVGVATDSAGDVFVSYDASNSNSGRQAGVEEYPANGSQFEAFWTTGSLAHPGPLVALDPSASIPNLQADDILEMQPDGELFAYRPSSGQVEKYDDFRNYSVNESDVYDLQTGRSLNLSGAINLSNAVYGDFGANGSNLLVSGESNGWDFVLRIAYTENDSSQVFDTLKVLVASPTSDGETAPKGLAVNDQGTVLTTLPIRPAGARLGVDVPVAFDALFDQGNSPAPQFPTLGLATVPVIDAQGITTDGTGNFVVATGETSLLDGAPGYVAISPDLTWYSAQESTPPDQDSPSPQPWGIAVPANASGTVMVTVPNQNEVLGDGYTPPPAGAYTPAQSRHAYGVDQITFTGPDGTTIRGDGAGQTIAILDEGYDPTISADLKQFDRTFGLPDPQFQQINNQNVPVIPDIIGETTLDVEWAHAIAPAAKIVLFDFSGAGDYAAQFTSLMDEVQYAASYPDVSVVSISYGAGEAALFQQGWNQQSYDRDFLAPGVTFLVSSGDSGIFPNSGTTIGVSYPASSPDVVAVGGTTLQNLDAAGHYPGTGPNEEIGWGNGLLSGQAGGSGGGMSRYEAEPSWQQQVVPTSLDWTGGRAVPDVAWDADPNTGFYVYYSTPDSSGATGWQQLGGTSIAAPQWAGLIAIANQERVAEGGMPLTGYDQTLPALYSLPSRDFHDIVYGNNGYPAGPGYDLVTGLGTPVANLLVSDLASYQMASQLVVTAEPPGRVTAGSGFGFTVAVEDPFGNVIRNYDGSVTVTLTNDSKGGSVTVTAVNGVAAFTVDVTLAGTFTLTATSGSLTPATTTGFDVTPAAASRLVVATQPPSRVTAGAGFGLTIKVEDRFGNVVTSFTGTVSLALAKNPGGSTLGGTVTVTVINGVATFSGLTLRKAGSGYTLTASSGGLTAATTSGVTVTPAAASKLVITTQPPSRVTPGLGFGLAVAVEDPFGNVVTSFTGTVSLALAKNPGGSTLGGTVTVTVINGVATFSGLILRKAGSGYTLTATTKGLTSATTDAFTVT
jgi:hypothetical protein